MKKTLPLGKPWAKRLPRKPYDNAGRKRKQCQALPVDSLDLRKLAGRKAPAAPVPSASSGSQEPQHSDRRKSQRVAPPEHRLTVGRTAENFWKLFHTRVLAECASDIQSPLRPEKGLSCLDSRGSECFIVNTFLCRGQQMADIAPIRVDGAKTFFRSVDLISVRQASLRDVSLHYRVASATKDIVCLQPAGDCSTPEDILPALAQLSQGAGGAPDPPSNQCPAQLRLEPLRVRPRTGDIHTQRFGHRHKLSARYDKRIGFREHFFFGRGPPTVFSSKKLFLFSLSCRGDLQSCWMFPCYACWTSRHIASVSALASGIQRQSATIFL